MPGPEIQIHHPEKGDRLVGADQTDLLREALNSGWSVDTATQIRHPDKGMRVVDPGQTDLLREALAKGWQLDATAPEPERQTEGLPDIPLAEDQGAAPITLESVDRAAYEKSDAARSQERFQRELAAQRDREALERSEGVGYEAWKADPAHAASNLVQTAGEGLARGYSVGFDAPMAAVQATVDQVGANTADSPGPEFTPHRGITPGGEQPATTWADRFDAAMGDIQTRRDVNPVTAFTGEVAGAVVPTLAAGPAAGNSVLARLAANAPTGRIAAAAARLGVRAAAPVAARAAAPGLAGSLARIGAPALALGVEGGVQGAAQNAGAAANALWQSEDDASVWQYLSAMGEGALAGFGVGGLAGGLLGTVRGVRGAKRGPVALREQGLLPEPQPELPAPTAPAELAGPYPVPEAPGTGTALARKAVKLTPDAAKALRDPLYDETQPLADEFFQLRGHLDNDLDLKAKKTYVMEHGKTPLSTQYDLESVRYTSGLPSPEELDALIKDPAIAADKFGTAALLRRLQVQLKASVDNLFKLNEERPLVEGDLFWTLDQMKRDTDYVVNRTNNGNQHVFEILKPRADALREALMDEEMWTPELPKMQRATNSSWSQSIAATNDTAMKPILHYEGEHAQWNPYEQPPKVSGEWLYKHMGNVGVHPPEAQTVKAFNRLLNAHTDDAITRAQVYGSDEMLKIARRMVELRKSLQTKLGQAVEINKNVSTAPDVAKHLGVLNQLPGASYALERAGDKVREAAYKATVQSVQEIDSASQLKGLVLGAKPANDVAVGAAAARGASQAAANPREVAEYIERLVAGDPRRDEAVARLEQTVSPGLGKAATAALEKQRAFLQTKVGDPKDPQSEQRMLEYGSAMMRPVDALKRIGAGIGTKADRETVQELYPALWDRFVRTALKRLAKSDATYDDRIRASRALGVPLDPSVTPERYRALQEAAAQSMMQAPQTQTAPPP